MFFAILLAAGGLSTLISGVPIPSDTTVSSTQSLQARSSYNVYAGEGTTANGWPSISDWVSDFDTMFNNNKGVLSSSCTQWGVPNNSDDEIAQISSSIKSVASSTGVDPRFILAITLQESNGCVRAPTTNYGVRNPGLMQSHNGAGTCNDASVSNPCPANQITLMIQDGTAGTSSGDGLKQCMAQAGSTDVSMYYKAARIYNSGSIDQSGNLGAGIATHCYASDIANRLTGWSSGASSCDANSISTLTTSPNAAPAGSSSGTTTTPTSASPSATTSTPAQGGVFAQGGSGSAGTATQPTATPAAAAPVVSIGTSTGGQQYPGATSGCQKFYTVQPGDYCYLLEQNFGVSMSDLTNWNSGLNSDCSNLWLGYQYCIKA